MADWLSARGDWDIAVLEMGINSLDMSEEEFAARVQYFVRTVVQKNPGKPVFCIDIFYYQGDLDGSEKADAFRRIMADERTNGIPLVLETPDETLWPDEIAMLKGFAEAE